MPADSGRKKMARNLHPPHMESAELLLALRRCGHGVSAVNDLEADF
jgi:hypothetical protein